MRGEPEGVEGHDRRAVAGVVDRPRLTARLQRPWPQILVVRAATGSGKTTLLRSWAVSRADPSPLLWVTISAEVASTAAFWTRVVTVALRSGELSTSTSGALVERIARSVDPVEVAIDFLSGAGPVTFVLDAYEKVGTATEAVDADLLRLTEQLPAVRVIVAARGRTGLTDERLVLRDKVSVIGDEDLAFTEAEVAQLSRMHLGRQDAGLVASVARATRGYALSVRAVLLAMSRQPALPAVGSREWRRLVATDLKSALPDEHSADFVAQTCVPPYFDADLAAQLTGRADVADLLGVLEREGFGRWIPYSRGHPVFQYVDSIRDAFLAQVQESSDPSYRRNANLAARWLFAQGDHEMAFDFALRSRDYALAVRVYVDLLREQPECYLTDRLIGPLGSLPVAVLRQHPMLAFALGLARLTHPVLRSSAPEAFSLALNNSTATPIVSPELDPFIDRSVRAVSLRLVGRFADAARAARTAMAQLGELSPDRLDSFGEVIAMVLRQLSYSLLQGGLYEPAIATMNRSAALTRSAAARNCALAYATGAHAFAGELPAARAARDRIDPAAWPSDAESTYLNAMTRIGNGFLALDDLDFARARDIVSSSAAYRETSEFWSLFTMVAVHAELGLGQGLSACRQVDERLAGVLPPHGVGDNTGTRSLLNLVAIGWLAGGRIARADRILNALPARTAEVAPARMLRLILTDRPATAVQRLSAALAAPRHTARTRSATLALSAVAAMRARQDTLAVELAARARDAYLANGVRAHLVFLPRQDRLALADLAASAGDAGTAQYLGDARADVVPASAPQVVLTEKERTVLAELTSTASREQIAARLGVSPNTVKSQLRSAYRKLGVSTREAAVVMAIEFELLEDPGSGQRSPVPAGLLAAPRG